MLRPFARSVAVKSVRSRSSRSSFSTSHVCRSSQPSSGGNGVGKIILTTGMAGVIGVGGTVAYASVDKDFRKTLEDNIPGSASFLDVMIGEPEVEKTTPVKPIKKPVEEKVPPSKMRVRTESSLSIAPEMPKSQAKEKEVKEVPLPPSPPLEKPPLSIDDTNEKKKDTEEEKVEKSVVQPEETLKVKEEIKELKETIEEKKPLKKSLEEMYTIPDYENIPEEPEFKVPDHSEHDVLLNEEDVKDLHTDEKTIEMEKDLHQRVSKIRDHLEAELVKQLKRQAEAHADHVADSLDVQRRELTRKFVRELDEALEKVELKHKEEYGALYGRLQGIYEAIKKRAHIEKAAINAQELFLACTAIYDAVATSSGTDGLEIKRLHREMDFLRSVMKEQDDELVKAVVNSIPSIVEERGIFTDVSIKERFFKVERMARRTAMIGEEGAPLFTYFLSYLQSLFILSPSSTKEMPSKYEPIDIDSLNTFDILWLAEGSLNRGDLAQAVRYMTLLRGEPRRIATDWVDEARLILTLKQACRVLVAHAASVGAEAVPQKK